MAEITTVEIRDFLNAASTIATCPAACDEKTLGTAIALFGKLIDCRTQGSIQIALVLDGEIHVPRGET